MSLSPVSPLLLHVNSFILDLQNKFREAFILSDEIQEFREAGDRQGSLSIYSMTDDPSHPRLGDNRLGRVTYKRIAGVIAVIECLDVQGLRDTQQAWRIRQAQMAGLIQIDHSFGVLREALNPSDLVVQLAASGETTATPSGPLSRPDVVEITYSTDFYMTLVFNRNKDGAQERIV